MLFLRVNYPWGGHQLSPLEREQAEMRRAERRAQTKILKEQQAEVKYFLKAIPVWLARMGWAYWYKKSEKDMMTGQFLPVKLNMAIIGQDAYFFRINTKNLPRGVFLANLRDEKTIENLSAAAGSEVRYFTNETGSWYSVETKYGRGNIPVMVGYAEMFRDMPDDAPPLSFTVGMGANRRKYYGDMDTMINLLVGGTKGGGKSNEINVLLCCLISRNHPRNLRLFLTDLKGGLEFADYENIPHLGGDVDFLQKSSKELEEPPQDVDEESEVRQIKIKTVDRKYKLKPDQKLMPPRGQKILTEPHRVIPVLEYLEAELDRRNRLMAGKAKKLETYNKRYPDRFLSTWILVIDELATLMENKDYKNAATDSLAELARKGRAVGIYVVLATQTPTSAIVPGQISNNMDCRFAFRCGNGVASGVVLGSGEYDATRLPNIPGRMIWKWGGEKIEIQTPLIADSTIKHIVAEARAGRFTDARQADLAQKADLIFRTAIEKLHGDCAEKRLWVFVKNNGIPKTEMEMILDQYEVKDGKPEILINDMIYVLAPANSPKNISRRLVPIAEWEKNQNLIAVPRAPCPEILPSTGNTENENLTVSEPILPEIEIAESAVLALPPPSQPPANGKNGHHPPDAAPQIEEVPDWLEALK